MLNVRAVSKIQRFTFITTYGAPFYRHNNYNKNRIWQSFSEIVVIIKIL